MIFCANPSAQFNAYQKEIEKKVINVLRGKNYILGNEVESLEKEFASFIGSKFCIGVANGTDAIELALRSLDIGDKDEVISVSHTATASIAAICAVNATPVLVDININNYNIDIDEVIKAITVKTKAILAVHLYGHPSKIQDLKKICKKHKIYLIEDCSQAHGSMYKNKILGNFGEVACFSCYPTKNLGAIGDAGLITTNNKKLASKLFKIRQYGWNGDKESILYGRNSRLDELQATILRTKLKFLNKDNVKRRKLAKYYKENLKDLPLILPNEETHCYHIYHLYVVRVKSKEIRDKIINYLKKNKVFLGIHYPYPVHKQRGFKKFVKLIGGLGVTNEISGRILSLPMYPEFKKKEADKVIKLLKSFFKKNKQ